MIRIVIDTSVLVAAIISATGPNAQLIALVLAGKLRPYLTDELLAEYYRVFDYPHLRHLDRRGIARLRGQLGAISRKVKSPGRLKVSNHEEDNRVYECAAASKAHYIVTENTKHFKKGHKLTKTITARQLLRLIEAGQA
jgi:putative PIN family toxin of toxin-antitoxin system